MNELIFFVYIFFIVFSSLAALKMGEEALISLISLEWVLANLFVLKQVNFFGLHATASDALAVGATLGLNLVQEFYGKVSAKKTIWIGFLSLVFYTLASFLHCIYEPSFFDNSQDMFLFILTPMPRIALASGVTYLVVQHLERFIYGYLKEREESFLRILKFGFGDKFVFLMRNYFSVGFTQFIDTLLFSFLGLYGVVDRIWDVILFSYAVKLLALFFTTPFLVCSKKIRPSR